MDIFYLKIFVEICRNNYNISKTSKIVNMSQPAISKIISLMEHEFGTTIFIRSKGRFIGLTNSGKLILDAYSEILNIYTNLKKDISKAKSRNPVPIKIGASPKILDVIIGKNIYKLYENDNIIVEFIEDNIDELTNKFINNELDILIILSINNIENSMYYSERIASSEYVAILNKNHYLANKRLLTWSDLKYNKVAIPSKGNQTYSLVYDKLNQQKIFPESIFCISSYKLLIELPVKNDVVTILPKNFYLNYNSDPNVIIKSFEKPEYWNVDMYMLKDKLSEDSDIFQTFKKISNLNNT